MLPVACRQGEQAVQRALAREPTGVRIDGTLLSECLNRVGDARDVQEVGATFVSVAADLAPRARAAPDGVAARQLGYLVGALRRGAARTQGIHAEMLRRVEQELLVVNTGARAFRAGERAGSESG